MLPGVAVLRSVEAAAAGVLVAALAVATLIGLLGGGETTPEEHARERRSDFDVIVGLFLVATLALGLIASSVFESQLGAKPARADALLFGGGTMMISPAEAVLAVAVAAVVLLGLGMWRRGVVAWSIDPVAARLSGVAGRGTRIATLIAVAASAALAARLTGAILVTALLVLPGAAAVRATGSLLAVWSTSLLLALGAVATATLLRQRMPPGPVVVALLVTTFAIAVLVARIRR